MAMALSEPVSKRPRTEALATVSVPPPSIPSNDNNNDQDKLDMQVAIPQQKPTYNLNDYHMNLLPYDPDDDVLVQ